MQAGLCRRYPFRRGLGEWSLDGLQPLGRRTGHEQCKDKSTGLLLPACQFKINKKTNELEIENYPNPWKLQNIMDRSKE
jgi:hypothetical protein